MHKKGFTLIELLVVISIIGLIASIALASLQVARDNAINAKKNSLVREYIKALELYFTEYGEYPYALGSGPTACLGADETDCFGFSIRNSINNALGLFIPGPPGSLDAVDIAGSVPSDHSGILYRCHPSDQTDTTTLYCNLYPEKRDMYILTWVMRGQNTQCAGGFVDQTTNLIDLGPYDEVPASNTVCVYTNNIDAYNSIVEYQ